MTRKEEIIVFFTGAFIIISFFEFLLTIIKVILLIKS